MGSVYVDSCKQLNTYAVLSVIIHQCKCAGSYMIISPHEEMPAMQDIEAFAAASLYCRMTQDAFSVDGMTHLLLKPCKSPTEDS